MICVKPTDNMTLAAEKFESLGIPFSDNCFCILAKDGDEILGECLISVADEVVTIHSILPENDIIFFDSMLRSGLHVGIEKGARSAVYANVKDEENYEILGFIENKENRSLKIDKLFSSSCGCKK